MIDAGYIKFSNAPEWRVPQARTGCLYSNLEERSKKRSVRVHQLLVPNL